MSRIQLPRAAAVLTLVIVGLLGPVGAAVAATPTTGTGTSQVVGTDDMIWQ